MKEELTKRGEFIDFQGRRIYIYRDGCAVTKQSRIENIVQSFLFYSKTNLFNQLRNHGLSR